MWSRLFWLSALERAIKTFAQTFLVIWPLADNTLGLLDVDWAKSASIAGMAAAVSVLTSIASAGVGPDGSPSLVGEPPKQPDALLEPEPPDPEDETPSGRHVLDDDPDDRPVSGFRTHPSATRFRHPQD
jgi:hypothetical protein